MSNTTTDPPGSSATNTAKPPRKKIRPTYSCLNCHKRKVKCDRVKPCGACCLRGTPAECEYGTSKHDRHYIQQSARIESLVRSCESLKRQLAETRRLANLPPIKDEEEEEHIADRPDPTAGTSDDEDEELLEGILMSSTSSSSSSSMGNSQALALSTPKETQPRKPSTWDLSRRLVADAPRDSVSAPPSTPTCVIPTFPRSLSLERALLTGPAMANTVVEHSVERLISDFSPLNVSGTIALREASTMRVFSPLLCKAFEAASLTFAGCHDGDRRLEYAGHARYVRVLQLLQSSLYSQQGRHSTEVLLVILLSTIVEAFKQSSSDSILRHQLGGLELLRSRSPYRHRYGMERSLFVDLRLYWVTAALVHRKPTFMASKEWLTVPWSGGGPSKDILHQLLDIAVHIPEYLSQIDEFSTKLKTYEATLDPSSPVELIPLQSTVCERAAELQARLQMWKSLHADSYYPGAPWEEKSANPKPDPNSTLDEDAEAFPIFRCRNPHTLEVVTATSLIYPDLLLATSLCYYWALCLIISSSDTGLVNVFSQQERYQYACNICRSMKYYINELPGCLVSRVMFVLRTAFDAFADGMIEKEFLSQLFQYIGRDRRFPVFSNKCTSSSAQNS